MKIRITSAKGPEWYANKIGETFELTGETTTIDGVVRHCVDYNGDRRRYYVSEGNFEVMAEPARVNDDRLDGVIGSIAKLTLKMAELEDRIEALEDMRKLAASPPTLSREAVIERAREDVELLITVNSYHQLDFEFIVNRKKRTVVCLRKFYGEVVSRGFAKCAPDDVFNSHIGKAIAIRRALDYPVPPEYTQAPAPERPQVGDIVRGTLTGDMAYVDRMDGRVACGVYEDGGVLFSSNVEVIDDSRTGDEREAYGLADGGRGI